MTDEREHCFQTVTDFMRLFDSLRDELTDDSYEAIESQFSLLLLRERAHVRAECQASDEVKRLRAAEDAILKYSGPCNADPSEFIYEVCTAIRGGK